MLATFSKLTVAKRRGVGSQFAQQTFAKASACSAAARPDEACVGFVQPDTGPYGWTKEREQIGGVHRVLAGGRRRESSAPACLAAALAGRRPGYKSW